MSAKIVRCTQCNHEAPWEDWPKDLDLCQKPYVSRCLGEGCDNRQSPGNAAMRMMPGVDHPFVFVRPQPGPEIVPVVRVLWASEEAS